MAELTNPWARRAAHLAGALIAIELTLLVLAAGAAGIVWLVGRI